MSNPTTQIGTPAPTFRLKAVGSGRELGPTGNQDAALLLAFHDQNSVALIQAMQEQVRARIPEASRLLVASVVNMSVVPTLLRPLAESIMKGNYTRAGELMPVGLDVADYVIILLDWDGKVSKQYAAQRVDKKPLLALIDGQGILRGSYQGKELARAAQEMVDALYDAP